MSECSLDDLAQLLSEKLGLDKKIEVLEHLDTCPTCLELIYQLAQDRDEAFFIRKPMKPVKILAG